MEHDFSRGAVLWHCTEGKDRCGLTTALILEILGVDRKVIMEVQAAWVAMGENYISERLKINIDPIERLKAEVLASSVRFAGPFR